MKKIERSLSMAYDLLPKCQSKNMGGKNRQFHFGFLFKKNKLVSIGMNSYKPSAKIVYLGNRFNIDKYKQFGCPHAETDAISKAWGKSYIDNSFSLVIIRLNKVGKMQNSKPCVNCQTIIDAIGIDDVWWSADDGVTNGVTFIKEEELNG